MSPLKPETELLQALSVVKVCNLTNLEEVADITECYQLLLAKHFDILKELFIGNSQ